MRLCIYAVGLVIKLCKLCMDTCHVRLWIFFPFVPCIRVLKIYVFSLANVYVYSGTRNPAMNVILPFTKIYIIQHKNLFSNTQLSGYSIYV